MWPTLTILALALAVAVHYGWRRYVERVRVAHQRAQQQAQECGRAALREAERRFSATLNTMADGLLLLDCSGSVQFVNRACVQLLGLGDGIRGRPISEVIRLPALSEMLQGAVGASAAAAQELRLPGIEERWLQVGALAIADAEGRRQGTIVILQDVTRLKWLEKTREEFVANVSHELRTPLSLIKGYVETLLSGAKDDPQVATKFLQIIERNAERLKMLIDDLLAISELESGRVRLNLQPVALGPLIERVMEDFQSRARARTVTLRNQTSDVTVRADASRLEQVFSNLLDNAIKYGRTEGDVSVGARVANGGQVEIFVQDDGPGIPVEALERIFERFYRVDKARSREQGGTGLGLAIVKHIVQSHGGKVWAKSESGRGTTLFFTLPRSPEPGGATSPGGPPPCPNALSGRLPATSISPP